MSCAHAHAMAARFRAVALGSLFLLLLTGCYTRQIEGIQKDLNILDRKLHTLNQKSNDTKAAKAAPAQTNVLQLEDRLNEVTLKQSDIAEEVTTLRQNYADLKTAPAGTTGGTVDKTKLNSLERQVAENNRKTQSMQREVNELRSTFESMRSETKNLISLLKEEFGEDGSGGTAETNHNNQVSSTTVEDPPATAIAKSEPAPASTPAATPAPAKPAAAKSSASKKKEEKKTLVASAAGSKSYEVRPRDTLSTIAKKFGVSQEELQRLNHIEDPKGIKLGQTLRIP